MHQQVDRLSSPLCCAKILAFHRNSGRIQVVCEYQVCEHQRSAICFIFPYLRSCCLSWPNGNRNQTYVQSASHWKSLPNTTHFLSVRISEFPSQTCRDAVPGILGPQQTVENDCRCSGFRKSLAIWKIDVALSMAYQDEDEDGYEDTPTKGKRRSLGDDRRISKKRRRDEKVRRWTLLNWRNLTSILKGKKSMKSEEREE